jgi:hypothetical protein
VISVKLSKLPDRTPVKLSTTLTPNLAVRLHSYADFYAKTYGVREEVADLVPFMLESFLDGDADFRRASRAGGANEPSSGESPNPGIERTRKSLRRRSGNPNEG